MDIIIKCIAFIFILALHLVLNKRIKLVSLTHSVVYFTTLFNPHWLLPKLVLQP